MEGVDYFAAELFQIVPAEALVIAPEQKHLLEVGRMASEEAGWERRLLFMSGAGCFVGQEPS